MAIQPLEISAVVQALEPSPDPSADFLSRRSVKLALFMLGDIISLTLAYYAAVRLSKVIFHVAQAAFGPSTYPLLFVPFCAGMFYVMDGDSGKLHLIEAGTTEYKELGCAQILTGPEVWAPMALSGGKLVLRDLGKMICLDVRG